MAEDPVVYLVDDDAEQRAQVTAMLADAEIRSQSFSSGESFLDECSPTDGACVILDMVMPGLDGMDVHRQMRERGNDLPVIFLTSHADVPMAVRSLESGAAAFLQKPCDSLELIRRVREQLDRHTDRLVERAARAEFEFHLHQLTPREKQVMLLAVNGQTSKEIARRLGTSNRTVEVQRRTVMAKMGVDALTHLAALAARFGVIEPAAPPAAVGNQVRGHQAMLSRDRTRI